MGLTVTKPHRTVIIGSGFGGLAAAKELARTEIDVTVIAKTNHHLFQPLLYQVATGILSQGEIARPMREILSRQDNATVLLGEVTSIDLDRRQVVSEVLGLQTVTSYDSLIVAAGAGHSYFGNDHFRTNAPPLKTIDDALELRGRIFGAFELAEAAERRGDAAAVESLLTFAIIGAGPTGVEMAGQIADLAHRTLETDFRHIDSRSARVILVDGADQVLPAYSKKLGRAAQRMLEENGVQVILRAFVTEVDQISMSIKDGRGVSREIKATTKVWAAGVRASGLGELLASQSGAALDRSGRIAVGRDLSLPGYPEVFVVGDMAATDDQLPGVAQVAMQGGRYAAKTIRGRLAGKPEQASFSYFDKGSMAIVGRHTAVMKIGSIQLAGTIPWLAWLTVHLTYLNGFSSRITAFLRWTISFIGHRRSERTITFQQVFRGSSSFDQGGDSSPGGSDDDVA